MLQFFCSPIHLYPFVVPKIATFYRNSVSKNYVSKFLFGAKNVFYWTKIQEFCELKIDKCWTIRSYGSTSLFFCEIYVSFFILLNWSSQCFGPIWIITPYFSNLKLIGWRTQKGTHPSTQTQSIILYNQLSSTLFLIKSKINVFLTRVPKSMKGCLPDYSWNLP